MFDFVLINQFV